MMQYETVHHNFEALVTPQSRVLLLGSMASPKSREQGFFYGHPQNRFWRVLAGVFGEIVPQDIAQKRALAHKHHIALWDVLACCEIIGASDAAIRNPQPNDLRPILAQSNICAIFTTGGAAQKYYTKLCQPMTGMQAIPLPSTSPANAAWSLERLIEAYRVIVPYIQQPMV